MRGIYGLVLSEDDILSLKKKMKKADVSFTFFEIPCAKSERWNVYVGV